MSSENSFDGSTVKLKPMLPKICAFTVKSFFSHSVQVTALLEVNPRKQSCFKAPLRGPEDCLHTALQCAPAASTTAALLFPHFCNYKEILQELHSQMLCQDNFVICSTCRRSHSWKHTKSDRQQTSGQLPLPLHIQAKTFLYLPWKVSSLFLLANIFLLVDGTQLLHLMHSVIN